MTPYHLLAATLPQLHHQRSVGSKSSCRNMYLHDRGDRGVLDKHVVDVRSVGGTQMHTPRDAAKTMASLQNTSTILNKLVSENKTSLNNGMQGMNELGPAVDELRRTLATLRAAVSRLEENPAALLRGRERTQEFTP